jgi:RHS repeat-associated protein
MQVVTQDLTGQSTTKITDATGKIITAIDKGGELDYTYDSRGNQIQVKHGSNILVTNTYDIYGRQTATSDKNAGTVTYEYDAFGQLVTQTDNNGNTYTMLYDNFGRITSKQGAGATTTYEYYKNATTGCSNNNLSKVTELNGVVKEFTYDNLKRPSTEKVIVDGVSYITQYNYDTYNNLTKTTYPSGVVVNNNYDSKGNLISVTGGNASVPTTLFTAVAMDGFGHYTGYSLGNGKASTNTYTNGFPTRFYTPLVQDLRNTFNYASGNLLSRQDAIKGLTENFEYDDLNRLTKSTVNSVVQLNITYDGSSTFSMGNIASKTDAGNYVYKTDKLHAVAYITNPSGPQTLPANIPTTEQSISYTPFLKTASITEGDFQMNYTYGPDYQRVKSILKQNNAIIETKFYFGNYEKQISGGVTREIHYVSGGNGLCAMIVRQGGVNTFYFVYRDQLGSILTITDINGNKVAEQNFDAWGRNRNPSNWQYASVPTNPAWLFRGYTGHEHIPQFTLINMNGRMYDPIEGRMLSPDNYISDPLNTQAYNRFTYAMNNPLSYVDPDGNFVFLIPIIAAAVFAAGNTVTHAIRGDIHNFWDGVKYFGQGAIAGAAIGTGIGFGLSVPVLGTVIKGASLLNTITTGLSVFNGIGQGISTGNWSALGNAGKILAGKFYLDENKSFFGGVLEGVSRYSWQSIQTTLGYNLSQVRNILGGIDEVNYLGGATFASGTNRSGDQWGVTIGNFINAHLADDNTNIIQNPLLMHEYGHYVQSQRKGILYPFLVMIPSVISASNSREISGTNLFTHDIRKYEMGANRNAADYFGKYYHVNWNIYEPPSDSYPTHWP